MRISYSKVLLGLIFLAAGIMLLVYAQHGLHQEQIAAGPKPFFEKVHDFFIDVGNWFKSTAVATPPPPTHAHVRNEIALWSGAALGAIGVLLLLFCRKKSR
jgi:hypothetical protein